MTALSITRHSVKYFKSDYVLRCLLLLPFRITKINLSETNGNAYKQALI